MTIKVSLNTAATPPVTVDPLKENVNSGNQTIVWVPAPNQPNFTFVGVTFSTPNPFSPPTITTNPAKMTVTENNNSANTDYPYTITVALNGVNYSSGVGTTGTGGTPVIHNN